MGAENNSWTSELAHDQWTPLSVSGSRPSARYKHAAVAVDQKLYISGGSRNGRYLSDMHILDLQTLSWSSPPLTVEPNAMTKSLQESFPATSGHSMVKWTNKLLLVGGHSKHASDTLTVLFIDLESLQCGMLETSGKVPAARGGQSVSLVGSRLIVFGGEGKQRQLLNDVHALDLETLTWEVLETVKAPPTPRFDHAAAVYSDRYLLIFGGCSHSIFFNDLHVLDLLTMEWSQPQIQGDLANARAGHAGINIDGKWYIVGGGDNKTGASDTLVLDMSKLVLSVLTSVKERDPLASEGLSVSSALIDDENLLISFGGYNGKYNNEVFVMRPKPKYSSQPKIFQSPAAAAAAASVSAMYAHAESEKLVLTEANNKNVKVSQTNNVQSMAEAKVIREELKLLESALEDARSESSSLKGKIVETNTVYPDLAKELQSVLGQLMVERSRCAKLEAQISEHQKTLETLPSIEEEVQLLRMQKSAIERDVEVAALQKQGSGGGVWKWVSRS
ncbi:acyl-CoA-binding domain-containing protein 4-like [Impatiens glandulifera]|uniref:acyl-CoA-binding domain-containing protein 4-like n=1 Tax=Impatiens glandulifera TaxID=253017 RepID=UPI001FB0F381|nr:acyl-CoA-binding domain-containing protein 4-like [Impatiens glandulifera]XP_047323074.1 acyl-CoA-binding domain-containing protein 4-like [Impatiens glandulifera]